MDSRSHNLSAPGTVTPVSTRLNRWTSFAGYERLPAGTAGVAGRGSSRRSLFTRNAPWLVGAVFILGLFHLRGIAHVASAPIGRAPTIGYYDPPSNRRMLELVGDCHWSWYDDEKRMSFRTSSLAPYGKWLDPRGDLPYLLTEQYDFSLGDVMAARFQTYPLTHHFPSTFDDTQPDFVFFALHELLHSEPLGNCSISPEWTRAQEETTLELRRLAKSFSASPYPRIIVPVATIRKFENKRLLTPEIMEELKDNIIVFGIETDPLYVPEGLKYTIDVPYPTIFHLAKDDKVDWRTTQPSDYFLKRERPILVHYAGSTSHWWQAHVEGSPDGFALREVIARDLQAAKKASIAAGEIPGPFSRIMYDDMGGTHSVEAIYRHMTNCVFSLEPAGDSPTRRGFHDALLNGAIPVIFRKSTYQHLFPSSPEMNYELFTVFIDEAEIVKGIGASLIDRLAAIPQSEIRRKQEHIRTIARKLQYSLPTVDHPLPLTRPTAEVLAGQEMGDFYGEDAFTMILKELDSIRRGVWKHRESRS